MDGLVCSICGDRGCEYCTIKLKTKLAISFSEKLAVATLKDIVLLFEDCSQEMKSQAVRGIVAGEYAKIALERIKKEERK